ncbi:MAG: hypothetical protein SF052_21525 [Bacteroidia bacterium]|nr:hypothetical protein [Bacteroidia bacterium]
MSDTVITLRVKPDQKDFFLKLISMLGIAEVLSPKQIIREYQNNAPLDVPVTEEEVMAEIKAYRQGNE